MTNQLEIYQEVEQTEEEARLLEIIALQESTGKSRLLQVSTLEATNKSLAQMVNAKEEELEEKDGLIIDLVGELDEERANVALLTKANESIGALQAAQLLFDTKLSTAKAKQQSAEESLIVSREQSAKNKSELSNAVAQLSESKKNTARLEGQLFNNGLELTQAQTTVDKLNEKFIAAQKQIEHYEQYEATEDIRFKNKLASYLASEKEKSAINTKVTPVSELPTTAPVNTEMAKELEQVKSELSKLKGELNEASTLVQKEEIRANAAFDFAQEVNDGFIRAAEAETLSKKVITGLGIRLEQEENFNRYLSLMLESINSAALYRSDKGGYLTLASTKVDAEDLVSVHGEGANTADKPHHDKPICAWWSPNGRAHLVMCREPQPTDPEGNPPILLMACVDGPDSIPDEERQAVADLIMTMSNKEIIKSLDRSHKQATRISKYMAVLEGDDCPEKVEMTLKVLEWKKKSELHQRKQATAENFKKIVASHKSSKRKAKARRAKKKK